MQIPGRSASGRYLGRAPLAESASCSISGPLAGGPSGVMETDLRHAALKQQAKSKTIIPGIQLGMSRDQICSFVCSLPACSHPLFAPFAPFACFVVKNGRIPLPLVRAPMGLSNATEVLNYETREKRE